MGDSAQIDEPVVLAQLSRLIALGPRHTTLVTILDPGITHPLVQRPNMNLEVLRDLRERDIRIALLRDTDHVITELLRKRLGHNDTYPRSSPDVPRGGCVTLHAYKTRARSTVAARWHGQIVLVHAGGRRPRLIVSAAT